MNISEKLFPASLRKQKRIAKRSLSYTLEIIKPQNADCIADWID